MPKPRAVLAPLLLVLVVLLALLWLPAPGTTDVPIFLRWAAATAAGVRQSYAVFYTFGYPPLGFVFLRGALWLGQALHTDLFTGYKVSLLLGLLLACGVFWLWTRRPYLSLGLLLALLPSALAYGYTDIYFAALLIGALWALYRERLVLFTVLYAAACLVKWQPLVLAPFIGLYLLGQPAGGGWRLRARRLGLRVLLPAALIALGTLALFGQPVLAALAGGLSNPFLSGNALNLNWIITWAMRTFGPGWFGGLTNGLIVPIDTPDARALIGSKLLFWLAFLPVVLACARSEQSFDALLRFGLCGYLTYFMLNTGVHENHLFLAVLLAALLAWRQPSDRFSFGLWALLANLNLFVFYGVDGSGLPFSRVLRVDLSLPLAVVFVAIFVVYYYDTTVAALSQRRAASRAAQPA